MNSFAESKCHTAAAASVSIQSQQPFSAAQSTQLLPLTMSEVESSGNSAGASTSAYVRFSPNFDGPMDLTPPQLEGEGEDDEQRRDDNADASSSSSSAACSSHSFRELGDDAVWLLSSAKPGNGVEQLRDGDETTFWQSVETHMRKNSAGGQVRSQLRIRCPISLLRSTVRDCDRSNLSIIRCCPSPAQIRWCPSSRDHSPIPQADSRLLRVPLPRSKAG